MLNEIDTNLQPERPPRRPRTVGLVELTFAAGALLATIGIALFNIPLALLSVGLLLMLIAWRSA